MVTDPVCRMEIEKSDAVATSQYEGKTYYFCHVNCKKAFDADPKKHLKAKDSSKERK